MKEFIEISDGIEVRPEFIVKKEKTAYRDHYVYTIKILGDKEYDVSEKVFNSIK